MQAAGTKGTIRFDPVFQNSFNNCFQRCFQLRKPPPKQQTQVDALGTIVKLTLVDSQTRGFGKRFREPVFLKEILLIISDPSRKRLSASLVSGESVNLGERLHHKAGMIVVNEIAHAVRRIVPRAVCILIVQDEVQVPFSNLPIVIIREKLRSTS